MQLVLWSTVTEYLQDLLWHKIIGSVSLFHIELSLVNASQDVKKASVVGGMVKI
jgi:hypothetical protein